MINKLAIFDFDQTLVNTLTPDEGKKVWFEKTGKEWPHKGWWGQPDSLDMNVFDMPNHPDVLNDFKREKSDPNTNVIMLTGRITKLADAVKGVLDSKGFEFDGYFYNTGGATDTVKIKTLNQLLSDHPNIEFIEQWEDRLAHVTIFEQWGKEQILSGRLKNYKINVVINSNHDGLH